MKAFFFGYGLHKRGDRKGKTYRADLGPLLSKIAKLPKHPVQGLKETQYSAPLYLLAASTKTLMLAASKDASSIHALRRDQLSFRKMSAALDKAEEVVFASTVFVSGSLIAMASALQAPRIGALETLVNRLLATIGLSDYHFVATPLETSISSDRIEKVHSVSKLNITLRDNRASIAATLKAAIGQSTIGERDHIEELEITIRARRFSTIKTMAQRVANRKNTPFSEASIRFKDEAGGAIEEAYLIGSGAIGIPLEEDVQSSLVEAATKNALVRERLNDYIQVLEIDEIVDTAIRTADPSKPIANESPRLAVQRRRETDR